MDGQRLLKIVSSEDDSEVTILLPQDIQDQSFILPGHSQEDAQQSRHIPLSDCSTQPTSGHHQTVNVYPLNTQSAGQYQTNKFQPSQYQPSQQPFKVSQFQHSQISQYQANQNRPVLSTRGTPSSSVWTSKDYTTWTPKKASGKWLQQDTAALQEKYYELPTQDDIMSDQQTVSDSFTKSLTKNHETLVHPVKLTRTNMARENTSNMNIQSLESILPSQTQLVGTFRGVSPQVPINLSGTVPTSSNINSGTKSLPVRSVHFAVNTHPNLRGSVASPVYKSKLEKAVEQKHTGGTAVSSGFDVKHGSGTLKKLLCSDDLGAYKMFRNINLMPHVGTFLEQSQTQPKDEEQFLFHTASVNKTDQTNSNNIPKKIDMLLNKNKPQPYRFKDSYKVESSPVSSSVSQQSLPNMTLLPGMNMGLALNQLQQQLQVDDKSAASQLMDGYDKADMDMYNYTLKGPDGIKSDQPVGTCSSLNIMADYAAPFLTDMAAEIITQKEYVNSNWEDKLMHEQWRLRAEGHFCDAVFHCNQRQFKFHRIVMSAASPDFLNRDHSNCGETQLVLPVDIMYENVCLFMEYIYLGKIQLTVDNVQQVYRLSSLFDLSDLNKYCYDFCRLAKLGHLIISSPYHETARQVHKVEADQPSIDKPQGDASRIETSLQISDVGTIDQIADILKKKSQNLDPQSNEFDFDWLTSDPDQSNIPIRKRGRTRHKLSVPVENPNKNTITEAAINPHKMDTQPFESHINTQNRNQEKIVESNQDYLNLETENGIAQETKTSYKSVEDIQENTTELALQLATLPDPLATGKFDDTQLIKQDQLIQKTQKSSISINRPTRKTMVTRYRGQPKTMTVLEAASNKKAKYDIPTGVTTAKRFSKDKTFGRKKLKVLKSKLKNNKEIQKINENRNSEKHTINESNETLVNFDMMKEQKEVRSIENSEPKPIIAKPTVSPRNSKAVPAKKRQTVAGDTNSTDKENMMDMTERVDDLTETNENTGSFGDDLFSKTPRLRKSTIDQQQESPVKDPVYMRPPKKRTKEISEMMKIEAIGPEIVNNDSAPDKTDTKSKQKITPVKYKGLVKAHLLSLAESKQKKQTKSKLLKDGAILKAVYEVEQYGRSIEGEKHYRCCLCNSVFVFSKRAITHIVNTHDISLEETVEYIDVEHKKPQSKKCDICGYVTKEINIYYIHFHKYFKHGVALPKGWQPFRCDLCKKEFFTKFQLREHKLIHFEDNPFVCELCGNGFKSRTGLNSHMFHKHSSVRNHKCPDCIKSFKTKTQMKVHQRTHTGEKPFACKDPQCNYRSTTRGNMKLHLLNRHKFTNDVVDEFMKDLKSTFNETSGTDIEETADLWDIEVGNEEDDEQAGIQVKMENFDVNHAAFETLVGAAAELANNDRNFMASNVSNEQVDQSSGTVAGQVQSIADQIMVQIVDNHMVDCNVQGNLAYQPERNVKMSSIQTQNIPRHVELLMQNNELVLQDGQKQMMCDYQGDSDQVDLPNSDIGNQVVRSQGSIASSQGEVGLGSSTGKQRVRHPSRDARLSVKHIFQSQDKKSLFKAALQSPENESLFRHVDSNSLQAQHSFDIPVDVPAQSVLRDQIITDEQIIHDLRQVQDHTQFSSESQFTGESQNIYRIESSSQNIALTSQQQQQSSNQDHMQSLRQGPISPPAYHLTTQSELSSTQSNLLMNHLQIRQDNELNQGHKLNQGHELSQGHELNQNHELSQSQGNTANLASIQPGQNFSNIVVSQPNTGAFNSNDENHIYPGFYQETYQIENY